MDQSEGSSCSRFARHHDNDDVESVGGHEIGAHLDLLRRPFFRDLEDRSKRISAMRELISKQPFERSLEENTLLVPHLRHFSCFDHVPDKLLSKLCAVAVLETWSAGLTVFGSSGLHIVLQGTLTPDGTGLVSNTDMSIFAEEGEADQHSDLAESTIDGEDVSLGSTKDSFLDEETRSDVSQNEAKGRKKFRAGDYFGTLEKSEDQDDSRFVRAVANEACEIMKISTSSFKHMSEVVEQKERQQVMDLIHSCPFFVSWPQKSLNEIASVLQWCDYTKGAVLVEEGVISENMFLIKSGSCFVKNRVEVKLDSPRRGKVRDSKQLVVGQLGPGSEVGERGAVLDLPSKSTISVRSEHLNCGCISHADIYSMDEVTRALFRQASEEKDSSNDEDCIKQTYVEKQSQRAWQMEKKRAVADTLHYCGIQPSYGKWARNPTTADVQHLSSKLA